jgi:asparagine synthase (glutamine-hydrolysing)
MPWELPEVLDGEMVREGWRVLEPLARLDETHKTIRNERLKITALEMIWYLRNQLMRDADWASMAHSLEVRTPFVDWNLLRDLAASLALVHAPRKPDLAQLPAKSLPEGVLSRRKTGFSIPVREWMLAAMGKPERGLRGWARVLHGYHGNDESESMRT